MEIRVSGAHPQPMHWAKQKETGVVPSSVSGGDAKVIAGLWGKLTWSVFTGAEFTLGLMQCQLNHGVRFVIEAIKARPVMFIAWDNLFTLRGSGLTDSLFPAKHFNISFSPSCSHELKFNGQGSYQVLIIELNDSLLQYYAAHCSMLQIFVLKLNEHVPSVLHAEPILLNYGMMDVINTMLQCRMLPPLANQYYQALIIELVLLIVDAIIAAANQAKPFEWQVAEKARQLIVKDFEVFHTIKELAKKCGTTEVLLQQAFKKICGQSIGRFSREARLTEAYKLLEQTDLTLRVICTMVGYNEASNFSIAFKKQFGFWPGEVQRKKQLKQKI